jgi:hypothetical protein
MIIAMDLDGVLCDIDVALLRVIDNIKDDKARLSAEEWYYRERKPLLNPKLFLRDSDEFHIITSRPKRLVQVTTKWIGHYLPNSNLHIVFQDTIKCGENGSKDIAEYCKQKVILKAKKINQLGIEVFIDDEAEAFDLFRELCPDCKILKYGGRVEL